MLDERNISLEERCIVDVVDFGQHWKGYFGCLWCSVSKECMEASPFQKNSLIFKGPVKRAQIPLPEEKKVIARAKVKISRPSGRLQGFFNPNS